MKKSYIFIGLGVLLLGLGIYLLVSTEEPKIIEPGPSLLSKEEATSVLQQAVKDVINVYESPNNVFDTSLDEINGVKWYKINNYSDVIGTIFTDNGIKQFEKMAFGKDKYVNKTEDAIYFLSEIPSDNLYSKSSIMINMVNVKLEELSCEVTFSNSQIAENGDMNYYVISKEFKVVKSGDKWLVDNFVYSNK